MHGGALRSQQLSELVHTALPDCIEHVAKSPRAASWLELAALTPFAAMHGARSMLSPSTAVRAAWIDRIVQELALKAGDLILYDADRSFGPAMAAVAQRRALRVVAFPHNIEALIPVDWPIEVNVERAIAQLGSELEWLRHASQIWAIGTLDRDILQLFGLPTRLLPYVPPSARRAELLAIRRERRERRGQHLLIMGTVHNQPTRAGMLEQLSFLRGGHDSASFPKVVVAGYGTELLSDVVPSGVELLGAQEWPALKQLMIDARALWVHQTPMSGALTRTTEALFAGIPVVANDWAARGHAPTPGLIEYRELAEVAAIVDALPIEVPVPDSGAEIAAFVQSLQAMASRTTD